MRIEVNLKKKYFFSLLAVLIVLSGALIVYAYNSSPVNPATMGHSASEISPPTGCSVGQFLQWSGSSWGCSTLAASSGGSSGQYLIAYDGPAIYRTYSNKKPTTYVLIAHGYDNAGSTVPVNMTLIENLCYQDQGCDVTLGMNHWSQPTLANIDAPGSSHVQAETASRGPYKLFYTTTGRWRLSNTDSDGIDGNGNTDHILNIWNTCYLTDGVYENYANKGDSELGLNLLVWNGQTGPYRECKLIIQGFM